MEEILMELRILKRVIDNSTVSLIGRIGEEYDTTMLNDDVSFGAVIHRITKNLSSEQLLDMTDKQLLKHIQKIQVIEKD